MLYIIGVLPSSIVKMKYMLLSIDNHNISINYNVLDKCIWVVTVRIYYIEFKLYVD